jgi:hypothetical protein
VIHDKWILCYEDLRFRCEGDDASKKRHEEAFAQTIYDHEEEIVECITNRNASLEQSCTRAATLLKHRQGKSLTLQIVPMF